MFESLLMQVVQTPTVTEQIVTLITSVGSIVVAVGAISHSLSMRPELAKHKAALQSVADFSKDVGDHIIESKQEMQEMADIVYNSLPDGGKAIVNKQAVRLDELEKKLEQAQAQLGTIPDALDHI